jgi:hypothetical protein
MHKVSIGNFALHKLPQSVLERILATRSCSHPRPQIPEPEMFRSWMRMTSDAFMLGLETQRVIGLRLMKLSRGGRAAETEALRMVTEKTSAWAEAGMTLARGGSAGSVIRRYRTHVRANTRRLLKP